MTGNVETQHPFHLANPSRHDWVAWGLVAIALTAALVFHLLPALLGGLLVFELVKGLSPYLYKSPNEVSRAKVLVVAAIGVIVVTALTVASLLALQFFTSDAGNITGLMQRLAQILDSSRDRLPTVVAHYIPTTAEDLRVALTEWLRHNSHTLQMAGADGARILVHILIGMVVGAMVALGQTLRSESPKPLAAALEERASRLSASFRRVVFAQVRIAAINAAFTGLYLWAVLPLLGVHLPLVKTMILATFLLGLIPVVGNLISNTIIVIVSLSASLMVAIGSLIFLVVIHKLEYFLNARIIGSSIRAHAWELLIAILAMESVFGLAGVISAPIYYAYLKDELGSRGQI